MAKPKPRLCDAPDCTAPGNPFCRAHWTSIPHKLRKEITSSWKERRIKDYAVHCIEARRFFDADLRPITVIYGPPASGKTRHAERFLEHYGCTRLIDDWDPHGRTRQRIDPDAGDLVLTQQPPEAIRRCLGSGPKLVSIGEALRAIGGAA